MTKIATLLAEKNMTVTEFCRKAKLHRQDVYLIRKGDKCVGTTVRARIASALEVSEQTLFDGDGWPLSAQ